MNFESQLDLWDNDTDVAEKAKERYAAYQKMLHRIRTDTKNNDEHIKEINKINENIKEDHSETLPNEDVKTDIFARTTGYKLGASSRISNILRDRLINKKNGKFKFERNNLKRIAGLYLNNLYNYEKKPTDNITYNRYYSALLKIDLTNDKQSKLDFLKELKDIVKLTHNTKSLDKKFKEYLTQRENKKSNYDDLKELVIDYIDAYIEKIKGQEVKEKEEQINIAKEEAKQIKEEAKQIKKEAIENKAEAIQSKEEAYKLKKEVMILRRKVSSTEKLLAKIKEDSITETEKSNLKDNIKTIFESDNTEAKETIEKSIENESKKIIKSSETGQLSQEEANDRIRQLARLLPENSQIKINYAGKGWNTFSTNKKLVIVGGVAGGLGVASTAGTVGLSSLPNIINSFKKKEDDPKKPIDNSFVQPSKPIPIPEKPKIIYRGKRQRHKEGTHQISLRDSKYNRIYINYGKKIK